MDVYECEPEHRNFPDFQFQRVKQNTYPVLASSEFTVNKAMIDCNHHVHNPAYLDLAAEVLPEDLDTVLFNHLEISYKHEIKPGETVLLEYVKNEDKHLIFVLDRTDRSLHAIISLH